MFCFQYLNQLVMFYFIEVFIIVNEFRIYILFYMQISLDEDVKSPE